MRVYLSTTAEPDLALAAQSFIQRKGYTPVLPHEFASINDRHEAIRFCSAIYMLPGWSESTEARGEHEAAKAGGVVAWYA